MRYVICDASNLMDLLHKAKLSITISSFELIKLTEAYNQIVQLLTLTLITFSTRIFVLVITLLAIM